MPVQEGNMPNKEMLFRGCLSVIFFLSLVVPGTGEEEKAAGETGIGRLTGTWSGYGAGEEVRAINDLTDQNSSFTVWISQVSSSILSVR